MSEQKPRSINKMAKELWELARSQGFQVNKIEFDVFTLAGTKPKVTIEGEIIDAED